MKHSIMFDCFSKTESGLRGKQKDYMLSFKTALKAFEPDEKVSHWSSQDIFQVYFGYLCYDPSAPKQLDDFMEERARNPGILFFSRLYIKTTNFD